MKKIIFILVILVFFGCNPKRWEPKIQNDQETLDKIFALENFNIEITRYGDFGGQTDNFELKKYEDNYLLISKETEKSNIIESAKFDSLKVYMSKRMGMKRKIDLCSLIFYVKAGDDISAVDYMDTSCGEDWDILNGILKFTEIRASPPE